MKCPACGHDPDQPPPAPAPKAKHCPVHGASCLVCTVTVHLDGDIDALTADIRRHRRNPRP